MLLKTDRRMEGGWGQAAGVRKIAKEAVIRLGQISPPHQGGCRGGQVSVIVKDCGHWGKEKDVEGQSLRPDKEVAVGREKYQR